MKIGIQTWGSDGDILPFIALAEGLQAADHEVTFAYSSVDNKDYSSYADMGNFSAFKVFEKFDVEMNVAMSQIVQCNDPLKQFVLVMEMFFDPAVDEMYQASKKLCVENDLVIGHMMNHTLLTASEKYKIPRVVVALAPLAIRTKFALLFGPNLGPLFNQLTWALEDFVGKKKLFGRANEIRKCEGLPPVKSLQRELYISKDLTLIASSPSLSHRQKDWGETIQICGDFNLKNLPTLLNHYTSRPCSGAEHMFSHTFDLICERSALHGEQCGLGSILTAYLHDSVWKRIRSSLKKSGTPTTAKEIGIPVGKIIEALVKAHKIRKRYTILREGVSEKKAIEAAEETGII